MRLTDPLRTSRRSDFSQHKLSAPLPILLVVICCFNGPNLVAKIGVAPSHGGNFHEHCNFTDRLFL